MQLLLVIMNTLQFSKRERAEQVPRHIERLYDRAVLPVGLRDELFQCLNRDFLSNRSPPPACFGLFGPMSP